MRGHQLHFGENMPGKIPEIQKNWASLADKATVSVSPKILQLDL